VETIRFYEREGLIARPARTGSNYRDFDEQHVQRLAFIRRCRSLDMALDEIRVLLRFLDQPSDDCGEVNTLLDRHIVHVTQRMEELQTLEQQLRNLRARCDSVQSGQACGILELLNSTSLDTARGGARTSPPCGHLGAVHVDPSVKQQMKRGRNGLTVDCP
jgi:Cd(II)/Pb(II)-responsive transcriptional regulator